MHQCATASGLQANRNVIGAWRHPRGHRALYTIYVFPWWLSWPMRHLPHSQHDLQKATCRPRQRLKHLLSLHMSSCHYTKGPPLNTDISGISVRILFYLQTLSLVWELVFFWSYSLLISWPITIRVPFCPFKVNPWNLWHIIYSHAHKHCHGHYQSDPWIAAHAWDQSPGVPPQYSVLVKLLLTIVLVVPSSSYASFRCLGSLLRLRRYRLKVRQYLNSRSEKLRRDPQE